MKTGRIRPVWIKAQAWGTHGGLDLVLAARSRRAGAKIAMQFEARHTGLRCCRPFQLEPLRLTRRLFCCALVLRITILSAYGFID